jgi:hypothetical protein
MMGSNNSVHFHNSIGFGLLITKNFDNRVVHLESEK